MAAFWLVLGWAVGAYGAVLLILLPMMIANAIIMSYTATNHLLLPLTGRSNPLADSMSVTTHPLLDWVHFNFSYHVEHHFFPAMSPKFAPLVRAKLDQFAPGQVLAPRHFSALRLLLQTPRMHDANGDLLDPKTGRVVSFAEIGAALRPPVRRCG
jgi:fatty acid desaturase